jgi:predicted transcriptional regulator
MTTKSLPFHSENNPHPTAVIREMRCMVRNAMTFYAPVAAWCLQSRLVKESATMGGVQYEITEAGRQYIERYSDYDPKPN